MIDYSSILGTMGSSGGGGGGGMIGSTGGNVGSGGSSWLARRTVSEYGRQGSSKGQMGAGKYAIGGYYPENKPSTTAGRIGAALAGPGTGGGGGGGEGGGGGDGGGGGSGMMGGMMGTGMSMGNVGMGSIGNAVAQFGPETKSIGERKANEELMAARYDRQMKQKYSGPVGALANMYMANKLGGAMGGPAGMVVQGASSIAMIVDALKYLGKYAKA